MDNFLYMETSDPREAVHLLGEPGTVPLAGGTDLLGEMKRGIKGPERLVNIKGLSGLSQIASEKGP